MNDVIVSMKEICKTFPGVKALDHVSFELRSGEVMALLGEKAGKSTLMKVLQRRVPAGEGDLDFGTPVRRPHSQACGWACIIHQD